VTERARDQDERKPLVVFIHIPKTAGTTLGSVLRATYPPGEVLSLGNIFKGAGGFDARKAARLPLSIKDLGQGAAVLGGHVPFGIRRYLPDETRYVTLLRDPIERTLSQYYSMLGFSSKWKSNPLPKGAALEDVLAQRDVIFDNLQTRMLSDELDPAATVNDEMLEQAKRNLDEIFLAFGLAERFDESVILIMRRLGLDPATYVRQRVSDRPRGNEVPRDVKNSAEQANRFDIELHRWATERFEAIISDQDTGFEVALASHRLETIRGLMESTGTIVHELEEQLRRLEAKSG
jgi:hypothetical protein